ncbi:MAG: indolepyruvate oxidoreductase subunit beta [Spirochaetes bacterium]|nr:indolepyruvate oxidoreductase subunit beta [Spirochaetota bacterium]
MKYDIVFCGVGGQGGISVSVVIARAAMAAGLQVKQSEVHGMSQRGGEVLAHLRISDKPIASPTIPRGCANLILAFEPLEALRYLPWLSRDGAVVAATAPIRNIPTYPEIESVLAEIKALPKAVLLDADALAKEAGNARAANIVLVGAAAKYLPLKADAIETAIAENFARKGDAVVSANVKAFQNGRKANP